MYQLLLFVIVAFSASCNAATFSTCGFNNSIEIIMRSFPDPIIMSAGKELTFKLTVEVKYEIGASFIVDVSVQKDMYFWMPVPCIAGFGSCTYTVGCDKIYKYGYVGKCPIPVGSHDVDEAKMQLPTLEFPSFLTRGNYWAKSTIRDSRTNEMIGCGEAYFKVASE